ncbi:MAG: PEP-CTERM sorting domain-containing protein, partial [Nitrosomonadales bacterium]|nr:PEP-CTERM sorting domain-containing protein [Nitrosomonadales bacterium]
GTNTVAGDFTNSATGTVKTTSTTAVFTGVFTNNGAFVSDPSNNYFSDLIVGATGYLTTGATGDSFFISNDFMNNSAQNTLWDTTAAYLSFTTGTDSSHNFYLAGVDLGNTMSGYTNNFAWYTLDLAGNNTLNLYDGNSTAGGALYVDELLGLSITGNMVNNVFGTSGLNVYYLASLGSNLYLGGLTYNLTGGGQLIAIGGGGASVPEPSTLLLLAAGFGGLLATRKRLFNRNS